MNCEYCNCKFIDSMEGLVEKTFHELICIEKKDIEPKSDFSGKDESRKDDFDV